MPVMDEFKKERATIKDKPFKEKLAYFWEYYKWWVIGGVVLIICLIVSIKQFAEKKDEAVLVAVINYEELTGSTEVEKIETPMLEQLGLNPKDYTIKFNLDFLIGVQYNGTSSNTYSGEQLYTIYVTAGDIDLTIAPDVRFDKYAYGSGIYKPVTEYLTDEEIEKYSDYLYYVDQAIINRYHDEKANNNYDYSEDFPADNDPTKMEEPVAVGFIINDNTLLNESFKCAEPDSKYQIMAIVKNADATDNAVALVKYLLEYNQ